MSAPMVSENWAALLTPGLRKVFRTRLRGSEELHKRTQIFPTDTSQRAYEDFQGVGDLGSTGWNQFEVTGRVPYDAPEIGFKTRLEHREFAKGMSAKRKLMEDNMYPGAPIPKQISQMAAALGASAALFREKSAAEVFINAFTDTGVDTAGFSLTGADGVGLVSTAHPLSPSNAGTQGNEGTLALTSDNVVETKNRMRNFTDENGDLMAVHPDTLLVPPELEETALKIISGDLDPDSANNTINVNKGRYNLIVWDYLTDSNAWFMIDSGLKADHLIWLDRVLPQFMGEMNKDTMIGEWVGYARWSRGWDDWRWIYGNNPS
jgi:hypothetical protein